MSIMICIIGIILNIYISNALSYIIIEIIDNIWSIILYILLIVLYIIVKYGRKLYGNSFNIEYIYMIIVII